MATNGNPYSDAAWWQSGEKKTKRYTRQVKRSSQYLTMRDGVKIAIDIYLPKSIQTGERIPAILHQTRYYRRIRYRQPFNSIMQNYDPFQVEFRRLAASGYAVVATDVRGTGASFGERQIEFSPDEVKDGAEVLDWIIQQPWSDGQAATLGISYNGITANLLLTNHHPAVKACIPMFAVNDLYADILRPGGIFNQSFMSTWSSLNHALDHDQLPQFANKSMGPLSGFVVKGVAPVDEDQAGEQAQAAILAHAGNIDIFTVSRQVEFRDDRTSSELSLDLVSPHAHLSEIEASGAAIYLWSSWFDGAWTLANIQQFHALNVPHKRLILGPWDHGARQNPDPYAATRKVRFDMTGEILRYLDYHLKDQLSGIESEPPVHYFTMGEGRWKSASTWPPDGFDYVPYFLASERRLIPNQTPENSGFDLYQVDYTATTGIPSRWFSQVNLQQMPIGYPDRQAQDRKLLTYDSPVFSSPTELTGTPVLDLYLRCDSTDVQAFAYLEDIAPDGRITYVTEGCLRAQHRKLTTETPPGWNKISTPPLPYHSFRREDAAPLVPGEATCLSFHLQPVSYLFLEGHRIRLAIAGADADNFEIYPPHPPQIELLWGENHASLLRLPLQ